MTDIPKEVRVLLEDAQARQDDRTISELSETIVMLSRKLNEEAQEADSLRNTVEQLGCREQACRRRIDELEGATREGENRAYESIAKELTEQARRLTDDNRRLSTALGERTEQLSDATNEIARLSEALEKAMGAVPARSA